MQRTAATLLALLTPMALAAPATPTATTATFSARDLAAEEARFAAHSLRHGMRAAFIEFFADDSTLLRPDPVKGRDYMKTRPEAPFHLDWHSQWAVLAGSGEIGFSTGPARFTDKADARKESWGQFFSIWRKQADGAWKVEFDHGIGFEGAPDWNEALVTVDLAAPVAKGRGEPEADFIAATRAVGTRAAYQQFLAPQGRYLRNDMKPMDRAAFDRHLATEAPARAWNPIRTEASRSGDFSYTLGSYRLGEESAATSAVSGYYARVWTRSDAGWQLAAEILTPRPK